MFLEELELVMPKLQLQQIVGILKSLVLVIRPEPDFAALVDHCHPIQDRRPSSTAPSLSRCRKVVDSIGSEGGIPARRDYQRRLP